MSINKRIVRIFLSSPGDVGVQRAIVREVISQLNSDPLVSERCFLELAGWDNPGASVPLSANKTPQDSVNDYVALPRDCDLTLVLLWGRLGTPLPRDLCRSDGTPYESGTVWELEDARGAGREVWVYRCLKRPQIDIDDPEEQQKKDQYRRLQAFVQQSQAQDGSARFGLHQFNHDSDLRTWLTEHLKQFVRKSFSGQEFSTEKSPHKPVRRPFVSAFQPEERIDRLIHLCDREDARDVLTDKLRERIRMSRPKPPIMCVLPGGTRQGHRGFLERIKEYEVRGQLPGIGPEHIALVTVSGKLAVDSSKVLGISILRAIRESVKESELESFKDLQKWMVAEDRRIFILALEPTTEAVRGNELQFLRNAANWLSVWVPKPTRQLFILVACVRHSTESRWLGPDPSAERARVVDIVTQFASAPVLDAPMPEILQLPELPSISREHVDLWLDHVAVRQLIGTRHRKTIDELFEEREYWSMDDLRDRLSIN